MHDVTSFPNKEQQSTKFHEAFERLECPVTDKIVHERTRLT